MGQVSWSKGKHLQLVRTIHFKKYMQPMTIDCLFYFKLQDAISHYINVVVKYTSICQV